MSKYLVTGDGRRLLTGDGVPLTADMPGQSHWPVDVAPAQLSFTAAPAVASKVVAVALMAATAGFNALPVAAEVVDAANLVQLQPASLTITAEPVVANVTVPVAAAAASLSLVASDIPASLLTRTSLEAATVAFDAAPVSLIALVTTPVSLEPVGLRWVGATISAARVIPASVQAASLAISVGPISAQRFQRISVGLQSASLVFDAPAVSVAVSAAAKFRGYWVATYNARQEVLNAIDANNRFLAKQAGVLASATADALIITDTRVTELNGLVTAQGLRIEQVTAQIPGAGGNLIKKSDFADMSAAGWINATVANAPTSGPGSQGADTYRGPYLTTVPGGTYESNYFPASPGEVFDVAVNIYNTTNTSGRFGIHFVDANGGNIDWLAPAGPSAGAWTRQETPITAPAGVVRARAWMTAGTGGNNVRITQPDIRRRGASAGVVATGLTELRSQVNQQGSDLSAISSSLQSVQTTLGNKADTSALNSLTTTVNQQGGTLTTQGNAITSLQSAVAGKADTSALNSLSTTVTQQGNTITSQGQAITSVSARVGDVPGNLVKKSDFNDGTLGTWINATINDAPESGWGSQPNTTYRGKYLTTTTGGTYEQSWTACTPGEVYEVSFNGFNTVNATGSFGLHFQDALGNNIHWLAVADEPLEDQPVAGVWRMIKGSIIVPAGSVKMRPFLNPGSGWNNIRITQPKIVKQSVTAAAAASAVELLDARVEVNEQGIAQTKSTWGVYLTAGNLISGVQSINDGTIAEFNVSANVFRVMSPSGAPSGMEWQNGYLRSWKENTQVIMGNGFGASNDLMFYAGPNVGVGNATKANAVFWIDSAGVAYFAGQVLQGVLRFFNSTTNTSSSASVETGQNNSNGKPKAVSARYTFDAFQNYPNLTGQITPGSGVTSAVVVIERQYSGGGWTEIGRRTLLGQSDYERSDASFISWTVDGSLTVTDADSSTVARSYRARVLSRNQKPYSVTNPGTTPAAVLTQYLSIESME